MHDWCDIVACFPVCRTATVTTASKRPRPATHHEQPVNKSLLRTESPLLAGSVHAAKSPFAARMEWIALAISAAASVLLLGWVMLRCRSGFDFTDEGFYLNWISNPWNFRSSVTQFGFVYHPLYKLVGGDIVLLRQANVLILFALGWALCVALLRSIFIRWDSIGASPRVGTVGVALVAGAGSLTFFDLWLPTPSYNSLTIQSMMLAATGALLAGRELSKPSLAGWILVGIGGGLAFLAKPTSAAMLGCMVAVYLAAAGKFRLRGLSIAVAVAVFFLGAAALAIDGSLFGFVRRIVDGLDIGNRLLAKHNLTDIFRWDEINLSAEQKSNFTHLLIIAFVTTILCFLANSIARFAAALIVIAISATCIATFAGLLHPSISYEPFQPVQFFAVSFGVALAAMMFPGSHLPTAVAKQHCRCRFLCGVALMHTRSELTLITGLPRRARDSFGSCPALLFVPGPRQQMPRGTSCFRPLH